MSEAAAEPRAASRGLQRWLLVLVLFLGAVVCRVGGESWLELQAGQAAEEAGDLYVAALHYERAVHWHLPASPVVASAADALERMAAEATQRGERELALWCLRSLRAGLLATRSFYTPHASRLPQLEERIAEQVAAEPGARWGEPAATEAERRTEVLATLRSVEQPAPGWVFTTLAGWLVWLAAGWNLMVRCPRPRGGWYRRRALTSLALVVVGYGTWLVGLMNA